MYCRYYQARLVKESIWFIVGCLKAESNLVFDRATDHDHTLFEFFVPPQTVTEFLGFMDCLQRRGMVLTLEELPNRLIIDDAQSLVDH